MPQDQTVPFNLIGNVYVEGDTIVTRIQISDLKRILGIQGSTAQLPPPIPESNPDNDSITIEEFNAGICAVYEMNSLGRVPTAQEVTDLANIAIANGVWISGAGLEKTSNFTPAERNEAFFLYLFGEFFKRLGGFTADAMDVVMFDNAVKNYRAENV